MWVVEGIDVEILANAEYVGLEEGIEKRQEQLEDKTVDREEMTTAGQKMTVSAVGSRSVEGYRSLIVRDTAEENIVAEDAEGRKVVEGSHLAGYVVVVKVLGIGKGSGHSERHFDWVDDMMALLHLRTKPFEVTERASQDSEVRAMTTILVGI